MYKNVYTNVILTAKKKKKKKQIEWLSLVQCIKIEVYLSKRNTKFIKGNIYLFKNDFLLKSTFHSLKEYGWSLE